jgi:hypothetical protein
VDNQSAIVFIEAHDLSDSTAFVAGRKLPQDRFDGPCQQEQCSHDEEEAKNTY